MLPVEEHLGTIAIDYTVCTLDGLFLVHANSPWQPLGGQLWSQAHDEPRRQDILETMWMRGWGEHIVLNCRLGVIGRSMEPDTIIIQEIIVSRALGAAEEDRLSSVVSCMFAFVWDVQWICEHPHTHFANIFHLDKMCVCPLLVTNNVVVILALANWCDNGDGGGGGDNLAQ